MISVFIMNETPDSPDFKILGKMSKKHNYNISIS